ncbi:MAG: 2,3-bisphosphoglycerate-independent phosphoglycerate mutase [Patescibacteria group bacterium]
MNLNKVVLLILDGWGLSDEKEYNAIVKAKTPNFNYLWDNFPHSVLEASGKAVGLPEGQMGNSEVGHLNIGAGRIVYQDLEKINKAIEENLMEKNPILTQVFEKVKKHNSTLHIKGLVSPGGVHSHEQHLYTLINLAKKAGVLRVFVHAFTDGKDTPPKSAEKYIEELEKVCKDSGIACIASLSGRYYAMDRDNNWERTTCAFNAITKGEGKKYDSALEAIRGNYEEGKTDEFIEPCVIHTANGKTCEVADHDAMIFFNFRSDRAKQLAKKFMEECHAQDFTYLTMTKYDESLSSEVLFGGENIPDNLAEIISKNNLKQLHIAETEKFAHVTSFFDGGKQDPCALEDRKLIESNKVATHDLMPEMKAKEITEEIMSAMQKGEHHFIVANFANLDMVGHGGKMKEAITAVETVDSSIGRIMKEVEKSDYVLIITADHGNAEKMFDPKTNQAHTAHTGNPVPFIMMKKDLKLFGSGKLADIAPTILQIMNIEKPKAMTGVSLIEKYQC